MSDVAVVAFGAISALGEGVGAVSAGVVGARPSTRVTRDATLEAAGLGRPFCARADVPNDGGRARTLLARALAACAASLDESVPTWRTLRIGLALGTSSGGMDAFEQDPSRFAGTYLGPVLEVARPVDIAPFSLVLGACASGTIAVGLGRAWLATDRCDLALVGGFDAVSTFVAAGFEALRATTSRGMPMPFRGGRDGLALGEGAAVLALAPPSVAATRVLGWVRGFGATCDANHLTAPDEHGGGLARAARAALADASSSAAAIRLVSAHGTATTANDAAEAEALRALGLGSATVTALKGCTGHTLGAAGALETLDALVALDRGVTPASAGEGPAVDGVHLADVTEPLDEGPCLKLSAAFGGANAALVLAREARPATPPATRPVYASSAVAISEQTTTRHDVDARIESGALATLVSLPQDRLARMDDLVRLALAVVADLETRVGSLRGAGIVVGHGLATIETNALFLGRLRTAGARKVEPRRFPYTTPNAAAGECATAFGLTGPAFAVGGGAHGGIEALAVAEALVASGAADRIVVVAVDDGGQHASASFGAVPRGAVATLLEAARRDRRQARIEATCALPSRTGEPPTAPAAETLAAHLALLPLSAPEPLVQELRANGPGMIAKASFFWL